MLCIVSACHTTVQTFMIEVDDVLDVDESEVVVVSSDEILAP